MVAIYTGHGFGKQVQNLAYSNDNGRTWTKYAKNPVLDIGNANFRDPKVFFHQPTQRWVMLVSLANEKVILFYTSTNLKKWTEVSRFGPAGTRNKSNWECPDLFELNVENEKGEKRWVLEADMGQGSVAGGSGGEYFVGTFDGTKFTATQDARWVDFGRDFYAPISWDNIPEADGRRIWIGWFNNWETCLVPTSPWRSCMSIPRSLTLKKIAAVTNEKPEFILVQKPVIELSSIHEKTEMLKTTGITWPPEAVTQPGQISDRNFLIETTLELGSARSCGIRIRTGKKEFTEFGYDTKNSAVYVDRSQSGNVDFHKAFAGRHEAPVALVDGKVRLQVFVDRSSIEVFINDGEAVISDRIFPTGKNTTLEVFAGNDSAKVLHMKLTPLRSIWQK